MAGQIIAFILYSPGLNAARVRTLAERDSNKLVVMARSARNIKKSEVECCGAGRNFLYSGGRG